MYVVMIMMMLLSGVFLQIDLFIFEYPFAELMQSKGRYDLRSVKPSRSAVGKPVLLPLSKLGW
jgi:hypothetical protein